MIAARIKKQGFHWVAQEAGVNHDTLFRMLNGHGQFQSTMVFNIAQLTQLDRGTVEYFLRTIHAPIPPDRLIRPQTIKRRISSRFH